MTRPEAARGPNFTLVLLPLLFATALFTLRQHAGPFWMWFHIDPSYFYLENGLMLASGESPADVFHPGTPVHVLVALVLRLTHPLASAEDLQRLVLSAPEIYLSQASNAMIALNAFLLLLLGRAVYALGHGLLPALAAQTAPFTATVILKQAYHVKPEPFLLLAVLAMSCLLAMAARDDDTPTTRQAVLFGLVAGFGTASKLLFAPMAIVPVFLLVKKPKALGVYVLSAAVFFLLFLSPAAANWHISVAYFARMAAGSGAYGGGPATFVDWAAYPANLLKVFAGKPVFDVVLLLSLAALALRWKLRRERTPIWRGLEGITAAQILGVLMVAKHPIAYYMLAAMAFSGMALALLILLAINAFPQSPWPRRVALALLVLLAASRTPPFFKDDAELMDWRDKALALDMRPYEACTRIYFDFASDPVYALYMGDMMTRWRWAGLLAELYPAPNAVFMNFFTGDPRRWSEKIDLEAEAAKRPCLVMRGAWDGAMKSYFAKLAPSSKIDSECKSGQEYLLASGIEAKCGD